MAGEGVCFSLLSCSPYAFRRDFPLCFSYVVAFGNFFICLVLPEAIVLLREDGLFVLGVDVVQSVFAECGFV